MINLHTNQGIITLELDFENTPKTAENFLSLAKKGYYDGAIFHRVINNFMIQGGGFDKDMQQKPTQPTIQNEGKHALPNKRGTIAMARTSDPHSASTQFFINVADNDFLNFKSESREGWGYCVFGKVVSGMDVVDKLKKVATTSKSGHENVPIETQIIDKIEIEEKTKA